MLTGFESGLHMLERRIDRVKDFGKESLRVAQSIQAGNLALGNVISDLRIAEQLSDKVAPVLRDHDNPHSMDIGGRATAEEINRGLRIRKEKSFWRVASLTFLGFLMAVGLLHRSLHYVT